MSLFSSIAPSTWVVFIGGAAFVYILIRQGTAQAAKTVIDLKNEQIKEYEKKFTQLRADMQQREDTHRAELQQREDTHRTEMHSLHERLGQIEGQLQAKDSELQRLTAIFQNRDPQSTEIQKAATKYINTSLPILHAIADKLGVTLPTI